MKIDEFLKEYHPGLSEYCSALILTDGDCIPCEHGHLQEMVRIFGDSSVLEKIPEKESPLFFLCAKLRCVIVDYENQVYFEELSAEQVEVLERLRSEGLLVHHLSRIHGA